jgi:hypothetical protein
MQLCCEGMSESSVYPTCPHTRNSIGDGVLDVLVRDVWPRVDDLVGCPLVNESIDDLG